MQSTNVVLKHIVTDTIMRSKLLSAPCDLDALLNETVNRLFRAFHAQDTLLCEKEVSARFQFLTLTKLRNMRQRGNGPMHLKFGSSRNSRVFYRLSDIESWIVKHYQLEPFIETDLTRN